MFLPKLAHLRSHRPLDKASTLIWLFTDQTSMCLSIDAMKRLFRERWHIELLFKALKSLLDSQGIADKEGADSSELAAATTDHLNLMQTGN